MGSVRLGSQRTALFLPSLRGGGAERVMVHLAIEFHRRQIPIDLVLVKAEGPYLSEIPDGIRIIDLGASRLATALPKLVAYLHREKPRALLSAMKHANVTALLAKQISNSKSRLIIAEHSTASVSFDQNLGVKSAIHKLLMKGLYKRADHIVAVSQGVANDLAALVNLKCDRVQVIGNPIVSDQLIAASTAPVAHEWFSDKSIPVVLAAGRLSEAKDFPTLIRAIGRALCKRKLRLIILGEGALRGTLATLIAELGLSEYVDLRGFVENPFAWMKKSDLFVLSSRWEGFGNVLVEAMACGTRVVSTDCPSGPSEILQQGKWGRLVPVGDVNALSQAIIDTLDNPGPSGVERAMEFSVERAADSYWRLLAN